MRQKNRELKLIFTVLVLVFAAFLAVPVLRLLVKSFWGEQGATGEFYTAVFTGRNFGQTLMNSFAVSAAAAVAAVLVAFVLAYAVHYTRLPGWVKTALRGAATLPMFIPTITYGFAIIYSFGKQGLITQLLGFQLFNIYGFWGLLVGYVIYTVPVAFLLICNTMEYVDKKTLVVSKVMGDGALSTFWIAVLRPLLGTLAGAFVQAFFLCFTDFGIPASVGGKFDVIATVLYNQMLGGIPDFNRGAVVAVIMLLPSVGSILLLRFLERYNIRYDRVSSAELKRNPLRDGAWGLSGAVLGLMLLSIFVVIFLVPMVQNWPYQRTFTPEHPAPGLQADHGLGGSGHQHHPRHGPGPGLPVLLPGHQPAEHLRAHDPLQHRPLLLHPLPYDEERPVQDERRVGDHRPAHGGQLAQDHLPGGDPQRGGQPHRDVQLLLH